MNTKNLQLATVACLAGFILVSIGSNIRSHQRVDAALRAGFDVSGEGLTRGDLEGTWKDSSVRAARIKSIAKSHSANKVQALTPFLKDESFRVRRVAVFALSYVATPAADKELIAYAKRNLGDYQAQWYAAAVEARGMKGVQRLDTMCQSVGLRFKDIPELSKRLNVQPSFTHGSAGEFVIRSIVHNIYLMGEEGQDVRPFVRGLVLTHSQRVLVDCATLSGAAEINYLLDDLSKPVLEVGSTEESVAMLLKIGPTVKKPLIDRLKLVQSQPDNYTRADIYDSLFFVLTRLASKESQPVLQGFALNSPLYIQKIARSYLREIQNPGKGPFLSGDAQRDQFIFSQM